MTTKLDALVAKHVMGALDVFFDEKYDRWMATFNNEWFDPCRLYSTDIAEAWKVVEKMSQTHDVEIYTLRNQRDKWRCEFIKGGHGFPTIVSSGSIEEGICIAALRAVGISEEEINQAKGERQWD